MKLRVRKETLYWIGTVFMILLVTLVLLMIVELGVRLTHRDLMNPTEDQDRYDIEPVLGWVSQPNNIKYGTDILGLRMNPRQEVKHYDSSIPPILFLGDSATWGTCTISSGTFISSLDNNIGSWRFFNGGVPGYSTVQQYLLFEKIGTQINPPLLVLVISTNDFESNTYQTDPHYPSPYAVLENGNVEIIPIPSKVIRSRKLGMVFKQSALFRLMSMKKEVNRYSTDSPASLEVQQEIMEGILLDFKSLADETETNLLVVLIPTEAHLSTSLPVPDTDMQYGNVLAKANFLAGYSDDFDSENIEQQLELQEAYSQLSPPIIDSRFTRLVNFGEENGITIVDLTPPVYDRYTILPQYLKDNFYCDYVHYNFTGHDTMADVLNDVILDTLRT